MEAERLMESIITAAQEGQHLMLRATRTGIRETAGDRFLIVPVPYRKEFILIYYGELGQDDDEYYAAESSRLEYGGFIFTRTKRWYDYHHYMLQCLIDGDFDKISGEQKRTVWTRKCEELFRQRITEHFLNSEDKKKPYNLYDYTMDDVFSLIVSQVNVAEMTLYDLTKSCNFNISERINEFRYLEDVDGYVDELVIRNYESNIGRIRQKQVILCQMKKDYEKLKKDTSHPIWKKAEIARVIPVEANKVNVTFKIGSCTITEKMRVEPLISGTKTELTGRDIPPNVSAILKALYTGSETEIVKLNAIETISYRNEVLYCKRDFMKKLGKGQGAQEQNEEEACYEM